MHDAVETVAYALLIIGAAGIVLVSLYGAFRCARVSNYFVAFALSASLPFWFAAYYWLLPVLLWAADTNYPVGMNPAEFAVVSAWIVVSGAYCYSVLRYLGRTTVYRVLESSDGGNNAAGTGQSPETGIASVILHFLLGAVFGAVISAGGTWMFVGPAAFVEIAITVGLAFGIGAAIGRQRFWRALANNPVFQVWGSFLTGRRRR